ncbi:MAG: sulfurtransferase TusA family protein [Sphingopyxis sp.]|uniref:sulfurtransferase TusA family protein n=1 Tax=Sphingopyxis sp. TaxID=1908224 RepID=UPI003D6CC23A
MTSSEESGAVVVDARGMKCPWPALRLARAMRTGGPVVLLADDPQAERAIAALAREHGWSLAAEAAGRWRVRHS